MLDTKILLPAILAVILFMVPQVEASQISDAVSPEIRVALDTKANGQPVTAKNWMVAAANPLAVEAGSKVLKRGGTAADAMGGGSGGPAGTGGKLPPRGEGGLLPVFVAN